MKIVQDDKFKSTLSNILTYIAKDSKNKANNFKSSLKNGLTDLVFMPYKFRKSIYFDNDNIRDYIFMGFCITYVIDTDNQQIILLDILKWNIK
ncbi:MAG: type II toxin-antitoxin system RelE/ParE family toxin [Sulfurimonas sp.]|jgi:hypothetical protein